jgi:hypothetical protein
LRADQAARRFQLMARFSLAFIGKWTAVAGHLHPGSSLREPESENSPTNSSGRSKPGRSGNETRNSIAVSTDPKHESSAL